jgi:glycosyltransferase involved in cell wall biosynthesis
MVPLLMVCRSFPPPRATGNIRIESLRRHLPAFGVEPLVLTGQTQAEPQDDLATFEWRPAGRSTADRIIGRLAQAPLLWTAHRAAERRRIVGRALPAGDAMVARRRPAAILASAPPSEVLLVGHALARRHGLPLIADLRDPWSYAVPPRYPHAVDFLLERRLERKVLGDCARVVVTTEASARLVRDKLGLKDRVIVIPNGYADTDFEDAAPWPDAPEDKFVLAHVGTLDPPSAPGLMRRWWRRLGFDYDPLHTDFEARSPKHLLAALEILLKRRPELAGKLELWLVGHPKAGDDPSLTAFKHPSLLKLMDRLSPTDAASVCLRADLLVALQYCTFLDGKDFSAFIPSKLYTYLHSGRPILAGAQPSEIWELVAAHQAGRNVSASDPAAMAAAIEAEVDDWIRRGARFKPSPRRRLAGLERRDVAERMARVVREAVGEDEPAEPRSVAPPPAARIGAR